MDREKLTRELLYHVRIGEDSSIEFKSVRIDGTAVSEPNRDKMAHEIAAFANAQGGRLVIGVHDKTRDVEGIAEDKASVVEQWLVNISQHSIQPPVTLHTHLLQLPNREGILKTVLLAEIPRSIWVHASAGHYYHRIGSTKQEMKPDVLARLFQQRSQSRLIRFDEQAIANAGTTEIDTTLKQRFLKPDTGEREQLNKLHLLAQDDNGSDCLSVSGVLLLAAEPTRWLPSAYVQCVAYRGSERNAEYQQDAQDFTGPLDQQIRGAYDFVRKNMRIEAVKRPGRIDIPQFHLGAVYEAIVNAVAHRDYSVAGSKIRIHLFSDRLEIFSPGALPNSLTVDGLGDNTVTRNETIVNLLSRYYHADAVSGRQALIERRGEGVPLILKESAALSLQQPQYRLIDDRELLLTIYAASAQKNGLIKS